MLRNRLSGQEHSVPQCSLTLQQSVRRRPSKGAAIYSRKKSLAGVQYQFTGEGRSSDLTKLLPGATRIDRGSWIEFLAEIARSLSRGSLPSVEGEKGESVSQGVLIVLVVPPQILCDERILRALTRFSNVLRLEGFLPHVMFGAADLAYVQDYCQFRQALFKLTDNQVELVLRNPALVSGSPPNFYSAIERAVSTFAVTPDWLGVGDAEESFDHSRYIQQVTLIGTAIHEHRKRILCDGVCNQWQESFVTALPIGYYSSKNLSDDL